MIDFVYLEKGNSRVGRRKGKDRLRHLVLETVRNVGHLSPSPDKPGQFTEPLELASRMIGHRGLPTQRVYAQEAKRGIMIKPQIVGVDISKETFDGDWRDDKVHADQFSNDEPGFECFVSWIPKNAHIVMEATGTYYLRLATFLYRAGFKISVVNPAAPAYFARMKLMRTKSDPVDAHILFLFGEYEELSLWRPVADVFIELNQLDKHLVGLMGDLNAVINRIEALSQCVTIDEFTISDLRSQRDDLEARIKKGEKKLAQRVQEQFPELLALLTSICGIGIKTAAMFIVLTEAFTRFPDAKRFSSYIGLSSFRRDSGSSVRGSGSISKMGNPRMRQLLYMAALTAKTRNKACKVFADRLKVNGKPPKVVRVAIANKLVRQAFAVLEKQEFYSECYA